MKVSFIQAIIAILVVTTFLLVTAAITLIPILAQMPADQYTEHLKTFASLYSGVIGVIVGYFFGKKE